MQMVGARKSSCEGQRANAGRQDAAAAPQAARAQARHLPTTATGLDTNNDAGGAVDVNSSSMRTRSASPAAVEQSSNAAAASASKLNSPSNTSPTLSRKKLCCARTLQSFAMRGMLSLLRS
eukprot:2659791-Pleurochrysis_carterae.AAC.1